MISEVLTCFKLHLDANFDSISALVEKARGSNTNYFYNWVQANWELLVERMILEPNNYLEIYGEGADLYGSSSRISFPDSLPTHSIKCRGKYSHLVKDMLSDEYVAPSDLYFEELVGFSEGYYVVHPPFNFVLCKGQIFKNAGKSIRSEYVFRFDELIFSVHPL